MNQKTASINLKELSYLTGFSISTISKALNDKVDISTKTKKIVMGVAKEYNYVPNSFAVGLRNNKSYTIAVILPQINISFYADLLSHFQKIADKEGYRILVFQSFKSEAKELESLKSIRDGSIDGAIVITENVNNNNHIKFSVPVLNIAIADAMSTKNLEHFSLKSFEALLKEFK